MATGGGLTITLGWPAKCLSPNSRAHWAEKYRAGKASKDTAYWLTREGLNGQSFEAGETIPVRIIAHNPTGRVAMDADNTMASCKSFLDGIALGLGVNDKLFRPSIDLGEPCAFGKLVIEIGGVE